MRIRLSNAVEDKFHWLEETAYGLHFTQYLGGKNK